MYLRYESERMFLFFLLHDCVVLIFFFAKFQKKKRRENTKYQRHVLNSTLSQGRFKESFTEYSKFQIDYSRGAKLMTKLDNVLCNQSEMSFAPVQLVCIPVSACRIWTRLGYWCFINHKCCRDHVSVPFVTVRHLRLFSRSKGMIRMSL